MATKRRRRSRGFRRQPQGKTFWLRPPAFTITQRQTSAAVFSDLILAESDFQDPSVNLNDTMSGAPVLERLIVKCGFAQVVNASYFDPAGFGQVTMLVEYMIWTQSDQFITGVTGDSTFDLTLQNERILAYGTFDFNHEIAVNAALINISLTTTLEPRSKVKLREKSVGIAIRANFDLGDASSLSNFVFVQPTMLVRNP